MKAPKIHVDLAEEREEMNRKQRIRDMLKKYGLTQNPEIVLDQDVISNISSAREASGKEKSKQDEKDESETQEFKLYY